MYVLDFCNLLIDMGIPPDTKIHLVPKEPIYREFKFNNISFNVNFSGSSCLLKEIVTYSEFFDVSSFILYSLTILGNDLLIVYMKG